MTLYLTLSMVAPLASNGAAGARNTRRPTDSRPSKSAVLGLVAGALGIDRSDEEEHFLLDRALLYAVRVEQVGRRPAEVLVDFHTTSSAPTRSNLTYFTRRDEVLAAGNPILSYREYVQDASYSIALWQRPGVEPARPLVSLAEALQEPRYVQYAGRKCCPLSLPLNPVIVETSSAREAFEARDRETKAEREFRAAHGLEAKPLFLAVDADAGETGTRREVRRDAIASRTRWQFWTREETICPW
jgi:CRISPR system Cascade subunit CasD